MAEELGDLRLLRLLGRGGMGSVWLAEHAGTGARYAVKVVETDQVEALLRFRREVEAQAAVDRHPNVARVHSAGQAGRRSFAVLELLEGGDLGARLRAGPLPPAEVVALGRGLARGLAHVHARGILHRDLKPSNVLFDAQGTPKLVDFGLARIEGQAALTETGSLVGTPAYMAPEQVAGQADARSDVYGLGALLFHAATGRPPFEGPTVLSVLSRLQQGPTPRARALRPDLPAALDDVLALAMARDPADRPPGAAALADALDGLDLLAARRRRGGAALAGAALLALAAAAALLVRPPARPDVAPAVQGPTPAPVASSPPSPATTGPVVSLGWPEDTAERGAWVVVAGADLTVGFAGSRRVERWRLHAAGPWRVQAVDLPGPSGPAAAAGPDGRVHVGVAAGVVALGPDGPGPIASPARSKNRTRELAVSPGGLVAAAWQWQVHLVGREGSWRFSKEDSVGGLAWLDDARLLVVGWTEGRTGWVRLCRIGAAEAETLWDATGPLSAVVVDPRVDGRCFVAGTRAEVFAGEERAGVVFQLRLGPPLEVLPLVGERVDEVVTSHPSTLRGLALLRGGLLSLSGQGLLRRWEDAPEGAPRLVAGLEVGTARGLAVSGDGRWVAVAHLGDEGPAVTVWRLDQLQPRAATLR